MFTLQIIQLYCQVNLDHLEVRFQFPFDLLVLINLMPMHRLNFFLWVHVHQSSQTIQILSSGCLEYQGLDCLVIPLLRTPPSQSHLPPVEAYLILIIDFNSLRTVKSLGHLHLFQRSTRILFLTVYVQTLFMTLLRCH